MINLKAGDRVKVTGVYTNEYDSERGVNFLHDVVGETGTIELIWDPGSSTDTSRCVQIIYDNAEVHQENLALGNKSQRPKELKKI